MPAAAMDRMPLVAAWKLTQREAPPRARPCRGSSASVDEPKVLKTWVPSTPADTTGARLAAGPDFDPLRVVWKPHKKLGDIIDAALGR